MFESSIFAEVIYKAVLNLLLYHAPPLLSKSSHSAKDWDTRFHQVFTEISLNEVKLLFVFFISIFWVRHLIKLLNPFYRLNYAIDSNHSAGAAYPRRTMHDYRWRSFLLVLSSLLNASKHLFKIFEVTWVRDHVVVLPPCCLQMSNNFLLAVKCRGEFEYAFSYSLRFLRYAY